MRIAGRTAALTQLKEMLDHHLQVKGSVSSRQKEIVAPRLDKMQVLGCGNNLNLPQDKTSLRD